MLHPLEQVRDHQNPRADPPALASRQAPQLSRPRFAAKKYAGIAYPPNMVRLPNHSTTSGNPRKPVLVRARVDLDQLSHCSCSVCTKKGILHLPIFPDDFELLRGKNSLTTYTFGTDVAQQPFCSHCGMHAFYIPRRSQPDKITVNARCLDAIDGPSLKPTRFFDGAHWEKAQRRRIAQGGHVPAAGLNGAVTLKRILDRAPE